MGDVLQKVRTLTMSIDSCLEDVVLVSLAIRGICQYTFQDNEVPGQMELSVVEAVNNAIKHAYDGRAGNEVRVTATLCTDRIIFAVSDSGRTMAVADTMVPTFDPDNLDTLPESGMGFMIICSAMDQVEYHSQEGWNILTMTKIINTHQ